MTSPIYAVKLSTLRKHSACLEGYNEVVRMLQGRPFSTKDAGRASYIACAHNEPISLVSIARNNGLADALWALRCIPGCDRDARLFAVWCARQVEHLMTNQRSKDALNVAERFANGEATEQELAVASAAALAVADVTDRAAACAAVRGAGRAVDSYTAASAAASAAAASATASDATRAASAASAATSDAAAATATQLEMFIAMCEGRAPWQVQEDRK
jgi:hypothetical protein